MAVWSLVVMASDYWPGGLDSISDVLKIHRVYAVNVLVKVVFIMGFVSGENSPSFQRRSKRMEVEMAGAAICRR